MLFLLLTSLALLLLLLMLLLLTTANVVIAACRWPLAVSFANFTIYFDNFPGKNWCKTTTFFRLMTTPNRKMSCGEWLDDNITRFFLSSQNARQKSFLNGQNSVSFCLFPTFSQHNVAQNLTLNGRSIVSVLGIRTRDRRMEGTDKSTELWIWIFGKR